MNGVAVCRKLVAMVVVALSGSGILVATSATPGAAVAGGCAGTAYVLNQVDGTVSVINTATGAVSPPSPSAFFRARWRSPLTASAPT